MSQPTTVNKTRAMVSPKSILTSQSPASSIQLAHHWHAYRPAQLNGLDVDTYSTPMLPWQVSQPFAHRLITSICAEEANIENVREFSHNGSVPKKVHCANVC